MFNPLALETHNKIELDTVTYSCNNIVNFTDAQGSIACRYQLIDELNQKEIWLEVKKDRGHNYQLFSYEKVQEMEYDPSFLALVGTPSIEYHSPREKDTSQAIYNRVQKKGEIVMPVKHIILQEDLPKEPNENGYYKDGNGNWYFMTKRSEGTLKRFDNNLKKRSWEYRHEHNRLLIEMQDENNALTNITIYEGYEIQRKNLKKVALA